MLYAEGMIKLVNNSSFVKDGQTVAWFKNFIQTDEGSVLELGSRQDFSEFIDKPSVFGIQTSERDNKIKLQLVKVTPNSA